jgi:uncharacterized membrane protein YbhN (UPF0104 family)
MAQHGLLVGGAGLVVATVWILQGELAGVGGKRFALATHRLSSADLALAALLTTASYTVLAGYELLAFANAGVTLSRWRIALTSFLGYAVSNTVGFSVVSGAAVRYRFYARWQITARQMSRIIAFYACTFWLGLMVIGGWGLWRTTVPLFAGSATWSKVFGAGILLISSLYLLASILWRDLTIRGRTYDLPAWSIAAAQYVLSILDWTLSAGVLWVLLPDPKPAFSQVSVAFVVAQLIGAASHLPGGIGAFEALILSQLDHAVPMQDLVLSLVAFRGIYYLVPFATAMAIIGADECRQGWSRYAGRTRVPDSGGGQSVVRSSRHAAATSQFRIPSLTPIHFPSPLGAGRSRTGSCGPDPRPSIPGPTPGIGVP